MTDTERLNELQEEIKILERKLRPLLKERRIINKKLKEELYDTLPLRPDRGYWFKGKFEELFLYINYSRRVFYTKPLYKSNGAFLGQNYPKKFILKSIDELREGGYTEIV